MPRFFFHRPDGQIQEVSPVSVDEMLGSDQPVMLTVFGPDGEVRDSRQVTVHAVGPDEFHAVNIQHSEEWRTIAAPTEGDDDGTR